MNGIEKLRKLISKRLLSASLEPTEPGDPALVAPDRYIENWFLSIKHEGREVVVEWRPKPCFGLSLVNREPLLYSGPDESYDGLAAAFTRTIDLLGACDQVSAS